MIKLIKLIKKFLILAIKSSVNVLIKDLDDRIDKIKIKDYAKKN